MSATMFPTRVVIYSSLCGSYDVVPPDPGQSVPCYLFTDQPDLQAPGWIVRSLEDLAPESLRLSPRRLSRMPKMLPHLVLPPHEISVWADANLRFRKEVAPEVQRLLGASDLAVHAHPNPESTTMHHEAAKVIRLGLDWKDVVEAAVARYEQDNFPDHLPLVESCFLVRRNGERARAFGRWWWNEYLKGSQRDQVSFGYSCWKTGVVPALIPGHARDNDLYYQVKHLGDRRVVKGDQHA